jgi:hypothetical protein
MYNGNGLFSCPYARQVSHFRAESDASYKNVVYLKKALAGPFAKYFHKTYGMSAAQFEQLSMWSLVEYADKIFFEVFEKAKGPFVWFSRQEWHDINRLITSWTEQQHTPYSHQILVTAEIRKMLIDFQNVLDNKPAPKYRLYSAHDSSVAAWINVLAPTVNWGDIGLSEPFNFELYELKAKWYVRAVLNGTPLELEKCGGKNYCTFEEFNEQLTWRLYPGDLQKACNQKFETTHHLMNLISKL